MQVSGPKVSGDHHWRAQGDRWAKKHGATIEDGPCGAGWGKAKKQMDHGKMHYKIFMH